MPDIPWFTVEYYERREIDINHYNAELKFQYYLKNCKFNLGTPNIKMSRYKFNSFNYVLSI